MTEVRRPVPTGFFYMLIDPLHIQDFVQSPGSAQENVCMNNIHSLYNCFALSKYEPEL